MALPSSFFRDEFELKKNHFALPEHLSIDLEPPRKRALTICNLFVNHQMSISNIERLLDEDHVIQALIESGIFYDRRQIAGRPPVGIERRVTERKVRRAEDNSAKS
jgi:hypothetical protein